MTTKRMHLLLAILGAGIAIAALLWIYQRWLVVVPLADQPADLDWYVRKAQQWGRQASVLRVIQVVLAATAVIASVLAASQWRPASLSPAPLAVLSAISISLLTGLDLSSQANKMRNAERRLTFAILEARHTPGGTLTKVLEAFREAETGVGEYSPQVGTK